MQYTIRMQSQRRRLNIFLTHIKKDIEKQVRKIPYLLLLYLQAIKNTLENKGHVRDQLYLIDVFLYQGRPWAPVFDKMGMQ